MEQLRGFDLLLWRTLGVMGKNHYPIEGLPAPVRSLGLERAEIQDFGLGWFWRGPGLLFGRVMIFRVLIQGFPLPRKSTRRGKPGVEAAELRAF